jgi:antagonist of KipI
VKLEILDPGFYATIQDAGRNGYRRFGVAPGGAMDRFALAAANRLVGNPPGSSCVEVGAQGAALAADGGCLAALAGCGFSLQIDGRPMPLWTSVYVRAGSVISVKGNGQGCWACLAIGGAVLDGEELGSRAALLKAGFGRLLRQGDILNCAAPGFSPASLAGRCLPESARPRYGQDVIVDVIPGPQEEWFSAAGLNTFYGSQYLVGLQSDRMGARLEGPSVQHAGPADILSEGLVCGSIQVPANGQPIVMLGDCASTGGYDKIGVVAGADLPLLAQLVPGSAKLRFRKTSVEAAQARFRALMDGLERGILEADEV